MEECRTQVGQERTEGGAMSIDKHFTWCKKEPLPAGNKSTVATIGIWGIVPHLEGKQSDLEYH